MRFGLKHIKYGINSAAYVQFIILTKLSHLIHLFIEQHLTYDNNQVHKIFPVPHFECSKAHFCQAKRQTTIRMSQTIIID